MKLYLICLFVAIATAVRPYRYGREEYRPPRRYSERYIREPSPIYSRNLPRSIRNLEEEEEQTYQISPETKRSEEIVERRFSQGRTSRSLPKDEKIEPYEETLAVEKEKRIEQISGEQEPEEDDDEVYEDNTFLGDNGDGDDEEEEEESENDYEDVTYGDEEAEHMLENEDEEEEYPYEETYKYRSGYEPYPDESYEHEYEHESDLEHAGETKEKVIELHEGEEEGKEEHVMPIELADIIFAFPNCDSITCTKVGLAGYGCKDTKCKFICSSEECYEYPDGPTDYEELQAIEEMHEEAEKETTTTEEIITTTEATTTTTTTTTTPEPEIITQAPKKRRSLGERRGRSRRARSRQ
nr:expressed conserved protein [Hymenolepis microstoma]